MGSRKYSLLTPFLNVDGTKLVETPKINRICKNHPRITQPTNKFCSECGGEIVGVEYVDKKYLTPNEILYKFDGYEDDRLCSVPYAEGLFIPNMDSPYHDPELSIDSDDSGYVNLATPEKFTLIQNEIEWFRVEYRKEIEFFENVFGKEHVTVNWGLVTYWS